MRQRDGFTLAELTTTLFVLSVGVFGVSTAGLRVLEAIADSREHTLATRALENEWERLQAAPWNTLAPGEQPFADDPALTRLYKGVGTTRISETRPGLRYLQLEVRWTGRTGRTIARALETYCARLGGPQP